MAKKFNDGQTFGEIRTILNDNADDINTSLNKASSAVFGRAIGLTPVIDIPANGVNVPTADTLRNIQFTDGRGTTIAQKLKTGQDIRKLAAGGLSYTALFELNGAYTGGWYDIDTGETLTSLYGTIVVARGMLIAWDAQRNGHMWVYTESMGWEPVGLGLDTPIPAPALATATKPGIVKPGAGLTVDAAGAMAIADSANLPGVPTADTNIADDLVPRYATTVANQSYVDKTVFSTFRGNFSPYNALVRTAYFQLVFGFNTVYATVLIHGTTIAPLTALIDCRRLTASKTTLKVIVRCIGDPLETPKNLASVEIPRPETDLCAVHLYPVFESNVGGDIVYPSYVFYRAEELEAIEIADPSASTASTASTAAVSALSDKAPSARSAAAVTAVTAAGGTDKSIFEMNMDELAERYGFDPEAMTPQELRDKLINIGFPRDEIMRLIPDTVLGVAVDAAEAAQAEAEAEKGEEAGDVR